VISLRLVVAAVLIAAAVAWCVTYFVSAAPPLRIEADQRSSPTPPSAKGRPDPQLSTNIQPTQDAITAYQRAAAVILKRAQNAKALADEPPLITERIPLPKRRPLPRP
jgi:hypothetical protein